MLPKVLAVDFDGTLCEEDFPRIGKPKWDVIKKVISRKKAGWRIILDTMREGNSLKAAVDACKEWGITFDAINDNILEWQKEYNNNPRKIGATEYWDDRAININAIKK